VTRSDLSGEAVRLGRLLTELLPGPEVTELLALMLLQESRRVARTLPTGELVLLEDTGPGALESRANRGRKGVGEKGTIVAPVRCVNAPSSNRGRACRCLRSPSDQLGADG
jgi:hypothetical protein